MTESKPAHNTSCESEEHTRHLCFLRSEGLHFSNKHEYGRLVADARYRCANCGRCAKDASSLCDPVEL